MAYDAIIIGAGHNGLVTAAMLARAGKKVLVLERRPVVGGAAITEELHPGFRYSTCAYSPGLFQDSITQDLNLKKYGYETLDYDPVLFAPSPVSQGLWFWRNAEKTIAGLKSERDRKNYPRYQSEVNRLLSFLKPLFTSVLPDPATAGAGDMMELLSMGWKLHKLREKDIAEMMRVLPMAIHDYVNEFFDDAHLKGVLASEGLFGHFYGPRSAGSVYVMMYLRMGRGSANGHPWPFAKGGIGNLTGAIAEAAKAAGAEIRTSAGVSKIVIKAGVAQGVVLENGDEITARIVISNADAKRTFLKLVDPVQLEPNFLMKVKNIRSRGVSAKVNLALDRYPQWKGADGTTPGCVAIAPDMDYLEHAFDDAKYGDFSKAPFLDIGIPSVVDSTVAPAGKHVMSVYVMYAPYHLASGDWNAKKDALGDTVIKTLEEYAPGISSSILHRQIVTPLDLETEFGLTEGNINHAEISLDQIMFMRPVSGYSRYRTPVERLYLCGAAAHPGGGVTGLPGSLAAREILSDFKSNKI